MKELTTYNRAAGYLNKLFDLLNAEFFDGQLERPVITIQSTPKSFGHFSTNGATWVSKNGCSHEINIGAGTLSRDISDVCVTLLHEMTHYENYINGVVDVTAHGTYHNKKFKQAAEAHGLIIEHHPTYGWTVSKASDELLQFCIDNDLTDILLNRNEGYGVRPTGTGVHNGTPGTTATGTPTRQSSRRYVCPCCGTIIRATKEVRVACLDCGVQMIQR